MAKLSGKQNTLIKHLTSGCSVQDACNNSGISRGSYYRWLKQDRFTQELSRRSSAMLSGASAMLTGNLSKAVQTLVDLLDDRNANTKRLSATAIIDRAFKGAELISLSERITRLEENAK